MDILLIRDKKGKQIMERMLVTQALNELKLLDSRILKEVKQARFVAAAKTAEKKISPSITKDEFIEQAKSSYQSIKDLIARRATIKAAVVASNAVTKVTIAGVEMTVADAIERKTSIDYEIGLLTAMKNQFEQERSKVNMQNTLMEDKIDKNIEIMLGKDGKTKDEDLDSMMKLFRSANQWSLVDPLDIEKLINELTDQVNGFSSEVDSALQISNCITWIEF